MPHPALLATVPQEGSGGVIFARESGAVSLINSTVRDCTAASHGVRHVHVTPALRRRTAAERDMEGATAASPRSLLATAVRRRHLRVSEHRCGLANRLGRDRLLGSCAPRRASRLQRRTAAGREMQRATAAHPALSSQPQSGGVIIAWASGAISIIGSTVKGCASGYVR